MADSKVRDLLNRLQIGHLFNSQKLANHLQTRQLKRAIHNKCQQAMQVNQLVVNQMKAKMGL